MELERCRNVTLTIKVCYSTVFKSYYQVNSSYWMLADTITVMENDTLLLGPYSSFGGGTWSWDGAGLSGNLRQQKINTNIPGIFDVLITYTNACGIKSRSLQTIIIDSKTGILEKTSVVSSLELHPNPATSELFIRINNGGETGKTLKYLIINSVGQTIQSQTLPSHDSQIKLDIRSLEPGAYYLKLIDDMTVFTGMFVKLY